jgi:hypothetical protein
MTTIAAPIRQIDAHKSAPAENPFAELFKEREALSAELQKLEETDRRLKEASNAFAAAGAALNALSAEEAEFWRLWISDPKRPKPNSRRVDRFSRALARTEDENEQELARLRDPAALAHQREVAAGIRHIGQLILFRKVEQAVTEAERAHVSAEELVRRAVAHLIRVDGLKDVLAELVGAATSHGDVQVASGIVAAAEKLQRLSAPTLAGDPTTLEREKASWRKALA